jgi:hypothetical protein
MLRVGNVDIIVVLSLAVPPGRRQGARLGQRDGSVCGSTVVFAVDVLAAGGGWVLLSFTLVELAERSTVVCVKRWLAAQEGGAARRGVAVLAFALTLALLLHDWWWAAVVVTFGRRWLPARGRVKFVVMVASLIPARREIVVVVGAVSSAAHIRASVIFGVAVAAVVLVTIPLVHEAVAIQALAVPAFSAASHGNDWFEWSVRWIDGCDR